MLRRPTIRGVRPHALIATAVALVAIGAGSGQAATSSSVVGATVLSATTLDIDGCASNTPATAFGPVLVNTSNVTADPCTVLFGSSNDTAALRMYQRDGYDTAMISSSFSKGTARATSVNAISDVEAVTATVGWGAGPGGLAATTDAGLSWTYPAFGVTTNLDAIASWSSTGGVAVGQNGTARRTGDGTTWVASATGSVEDLNDVDAAGADSIWAVGTGGAIIHSDDGGLSWADQTDPLVTTSTLSSVSVVDQDTVWASGGNNTVIRTIDGGATWQLVHYVAGTNPLSTIIASSATTAYAIGSSGCGGCTVRRVTTDGGSGWTTYSTGTYFSSMSYDGAGTWHLAGSSGAIGSSTDGLQTVTAVDSTTPHNVRDIEAFSALDVAAVADHGVQLQSADGGTTWTDRNAAADRWLNDISRGGTLVVTVGDAGAVIRSTDTGATWGARTNPVTDDLYGVWVASASDVIAVGANGRIIRSTDGAATWTTPASGVATTLRSVSGSGSTAWAVGDGGVVLRSTDGGATWAPQASGVAVNLEDVSAASPLEAWAVGASGTVLRTTDGGATWSPVAGHGFAGTVAHVVATSPDWQWLASGNTVKRTLDDGATWTSSVPQPTYSAQAFDAWSANEAVFGASSNRMFMTFDGGATWTLNQGGGSPTHTGATFLSSGRVLTSTTVATVNSTTPVRTINDHAPGSGRGWTDDATSFGACLDLAADGASTDAGTWQPNPGCPTADGPGWRAVVLTGGDAGALVARAPTGDEDARVELRFGLRVSSNQPAGNYVAPLQFEVIAPG